MKIRANNSVRLILALVVIVSIIIGAITLLTYTRNTVNLVAEPRKDVSISSPLPNTIQALVDSADIVVVAQVEEIANQEIVYFGENADTLAERDKANVDELGYPKLGLPMIDYEIRVQDILKSKLDLTIGDTILYRVPGAHNPEWRDPNFVQAGDRKLLFLTANPNGTTYGIESDMHMMTIDGSTLTYYHNGKHVYPFDESNLPSFLVEIEKILING